MKYFIVGVTVLLIFSMTGCGGVSHKSPEKVTEELINAYANGKEKKVKAFNDYLKKEENLKKFQRIFPIIATTSISAHKMVNIQECDIISENDKYTYVYITYNMVLEDDQEYPCIGTYMIGKKDKSYYILPPSQITDDMRTQAATDYADFMTKDVYKDYAKAYEKFIKKNPGYEDKISGKIS